MVHASVSFVVPVLNEEGRIAALLEDLSRRFPGSELLVVDGGSSDETIARAEPLCRSVLLSPPGRARQMNLGASAASGSYIAFLHADSRPQFDATELSAALADSPPWGFCRVRISGSSLAFRVIEWAMNFRSSLSSVATGDQMLFVRGDVFASLDGYADIPLMEDVEICKRLRRKAPPRIVRQPVITSSRRWENRGIVRTVLQMWALRLAYVMGVSPQRLWEHYYGR